MRDDLESGSGVVDERPVAWQARALCRGGITADYFWCGKKSDSQEAARLCRSCPVRPDCFEYSKGEDSKSGGIWGGLSGRLLIKAKRRAGTPEEVLRWADEVRRIKTLDKSKTRVYNYN